MNLLVRPDKRLSLPRRHGKYIYFFTTSPKAARCPSTLPSPPTFSRQQLMTLAFSLVSRKRPLSAYVGTEHQTMLGKVLRLFFLRKPFPFMRKGVYFLFCVHTYFVLPRLSEHSSVGGKSAGGCFSPFFALAVQWMAAEGY